MLHDISFTLEVYTLDDERKMWCQLYSLCVDMKENKENVHRIKHAISSEHASNTLLVANLKLRAHERMRNLHPPRLVAITKWYVNWFLPTMRRYGAVFTKRYYTRCKIQSLWQEIWPTADGGVILDQRIPVDTNYCIKAASP